MVYTYMVGKSDSQYDVFDIPIHEIWVSDSFNCRKGITRESVESMAQSLEREGLLAPIDVQLGTEVKGIPKGFQYRLVCGFRRLTACKLLGWTTIASRVREGLSERAAEFMNLTENLERKDLNILEEAMAIESLFGMHRTIKSMAMELNRPLSWVSLRKQLLLLPHWVQKLAASGRFNESDLRRIHGSADHEGMARHILREIKKTGNSRTKQKGLRPKKSDVKDLIVVLLKEGFSPELLKILGWSIGEIDEEGLEKCLVWLRDRKGWLK